MLTLSAAVKFENWLQVQALPDQSAIESQSRDLATIRGLLGGENQVWLGEPQITALESLWPSTERTKTFEHLSKDFDYYSIYFAVSFRAARQCEFVQATIQVHLASGSDSGRIIAYSLFPKDISTPITYKRTLSINPNLEFDLEKVAQIKVSAFNYESSAEYILYQPEITAFGQGESQPGWDFNKTSARSIRGIKDLFLIVQKPKDTYAKICFEIKNCQVQTNIGRIPLSTMFLTGTKETLLEKVYSL